MSRPPLRILQVMRAPVGGLFRHVTDLTKGLTARGHAVGIVVDSLSGDSQSQAKLKTLEGVAALGVHALPIPRLLGLGDVTTPYAVTRIARALEINVIHGHGAKGGFIGRRAARKIPGCAAIYTPHGGALHYDPHTLSGAAFMGMERKLLASTQAIIFESAYARKTYSEKVGPPSCRSDVIFNGLDAAEFEPVFPSSEQADFVYVGELRLLKGIDLLVQALAPLTRADGTAATLVMAGEGPDEGRLRALLKTLGLEDRVKLAGAQKAREMFSQGRCLVVPSRAESLPYIVLEAAAAGMPLVATRVGGVPEIFGPTSSDLVPAEDVAALGQMMRAFLEDTGPFNDSAQARREFVAAHFSMERMIDAIERVYAETAQ